MLNIPPSQSLLVIGISLLIMAFVWHRTAVVTGSIGLASVLASSLAYLGLTNTLIEHTLAVCALWLLCLWLCSPALSRWRQHCDNATQSQRSPTPPPAFTVQHDIDANTLFSSAHLPPQQFICTHPLKAGMVVQPLTLHNGTWQVKAISSPTFSTTCA